MPPAGRDAYLLATDGDLARAVASAPAGAAQAEEAELYRRFAPRVRLYGLKHLRDEAAAQDLAQQVLLVTIEQLRAASVREPEAIGSFILGTSRMIAGSIARGERRRQLLLERWKPAETADDAFVTLDAARVERCLQTLDGRDRIVIILTFYGEKSSAEIGEQLGLTSGAVRVARHRALDRLRDCVIPRRPE